MKNIIKLGKHYFKYDREHAVVSMMYKPRAAELREMRADNAEWMQKFGEPLWDIDENGLMEIDSAGLRRENWDDPEARETYLLNWEEDVEAEARYAAAEFIKYG